eukprot:266832_1
MGTTLFDSMGTTYGSMGTTLDSSDSDSYSDISSDSYSEMSSYRFFLSCICISSFFTNLYHDVWSSDSGSSSSGAMGTTLFDSMGTTYGSMGTTLDSYDSDSYSDSSSDS